MKLAGSNYGAPELPLDAVLDHCVRVGYLGAELAVGEEYGIPIDKVNAAERARLSETFRRHRLECSVVAYFWGVATTPEDEAALRAAIDLAADLAPVGPGSTPPPVTTTVVGPPEAWEAVKTPVVESIGELCRHALARGVPFSIKAHADSALDLPHKLIWLIEQIDSPALGFNVDMSHFEVNGLTIRQAIPTLMPGASHVHVKASRGRYPDHEFMLPGEGESDLVSLCRAFKASGYTGYLTVEVSVFVQRRPDYDPLGALTTCFTALSKALDKVGVTDYLRE